VATADTTTRPGRARLSFANEAEIDEFADVLGKFERGEISPDAWRAFRLVRGTYGQRQSGDAQMLRVKIPQGILTAPQLDALAEVAGRGSRGFGHITTRQNVQFHFMKLHDVEWAMRRLAEAGLTTREACGNSVRNITACAYAGVAADEVFDVTPYAEALTRYLLRHPLSASLPRKFKIAFEGCGDDHAMTPIHDIGWRARLQPFGRGVQRGFRVTVGGGTAILCTSGHVLREFVPAAEMFQVAEAVIRVFHRHGDHANKHRNRMKFLIRSLGWDGWREAFDRAVDEVRADGGATLPFDPDDPPVEHAPTWIRPSPPAARDVAARVFAETLRGPGIIPLAVPSASVHGTLDRWRATNVDRQKQAGFRIVTVTLPLGDLTASQMRILGELAQAYGDGTVRTTVQQNLVLRWVEEADVEGLYQRLGAAGLGQPGARTVADVTSCPGAESCRLAVTQSRGLGRVLSDHLAARPDLWARASGLDVKISGCPNGCGQHHVAAVGFQGSVRKVDGRAMPQYFVLAGGGASGDAAAFGRVVAKVPARRSVEALERLVALYEARRRDGESVGDCFRRLAPEDFKTALAELEQIGPAGPTSADFVDLGDADVFAPDVQEGECSA
jgi:sulfite reductase (NADPH) hemoprotein beta-component